MPTVSARIKLRFHMRIPPDVPLQFESPEQGVSCTVSVECVEPQEQDYMEHGCDFRVAGTKRFRNVLLYGRQPGVFTPLCLPSELLFEFSRVPEEWVEGLPRSADTTIQVGPRTVPQIMHKIHSLANKVIRSYRWVSGDVENGALVRALTMAELLSCLSIRVDDGHELYPQYIVNYDSRGLPGNEVDAMFQVIANTAFPQVWQTFIQAAETVCARLDSSELGLALVLADTALEVFIDKELEQRLPGRYEVDERGTWFDGQRVYRTYEKYKGPLREAAEGVSIVEEDHNLYQDLVHLHRARNNYAHAGELRYTKTNNVTMDVDFPEATRLVRCARKAIEMASDLLDRSSPS